MVAAGLVLGLLGSFTIAMFLPNVYEAATSILVIPQRVPDDVVRSTVKAELGERLNMISQEILSRTRLERIIQEFDLYRHERERLLMEDVVEPMRRDISLSISAPKNGDRGATSFSIGFRSPDPRTAMRVTERLASLFVQENIEDRALLADQTTQFLAAQAEDARRRLLESQARLGRGNPLRDEVVKHEVLTEHYRSILRKLEEARMAVNLERRQIGEQFKVIDAARLPERPVSPNRGLVVLRGALFGVRGGFAMILVSSWRRRRQPAHNPER